MITPKLPHLFYGGDYNPDQWPEDVWPEDVRLMQEAGVNLVSLPIFSWAKLEPARGQYDFGWLDRVFDLLHAGGVKIDLATATASPPAWLVMEHPDILAMDRDGLTWHPGSRQHFCPHAPAYRERAAALVRAVAERYREHPAVVMWHLNNEYGNHVETCYCDHCAQAFRGWLRRRYGSLDEVNARWGTAFWSQWYYDWEEIQPPRRTPSFINPGQALDYARFNSDAYGELIAMEAAVVREVTPGRPVTTNFMGFFKAQDYFKNAARLDFTSWDAYPDVGATEGDHDAGYWRAWAAAFHDVIRATGGEKPWVLMEQTPSAVNWRRVNAVKGPGEMRRWSYQAIARGADGVLFFQWRASRAGAEKFHGAVVPHAGPETRIFRECRELGAELKRLDPVVGSRVVAPVGLCFDWPTWWAVEGESKPTEFDYAGTFLKFHRALYEENVGTTVVTPEQDWLATGLRLVIAPLAYLCTDAMAANVRRFVEGGGVFLTTYFSGVADENDRIHLGGYPHPVLREVLGLLVEEWLPQPPGTTLRLRAEGDAGKDIWDDKPRANTWAEIIHPQGAQTLATFRDGGWFAGRPAVTCHTFGPGAAYYVGTELDPDALAALLAAACARAEVAAPVKAPPGVEAVVRRAEETGAEFLFLLNGSGEPATVNLRTWRGCVDLLGGNRPDKELVLPAEGVAILQR